MTRLGLRTRLLLSFLAPAFLSLSLGGAALYMAIDSVLEESLGESLTRLAAAISTDVNAGRVLAVSADDAVGEGSRTYRSLTTQVRELQKSTGLRRILIFDDQHRARIDVGGVLPPMAEVPELLRDRLELQRLFSGPGHRVASQVLFEGNDGRLYKTGYAPLYDGERVVGAVAVEGTAMFFGPLSIVRNAFIALGALTLAMLFAAAVLSARALVGPLERLVGSALRMGRGDLTTVVPREPTLEIGILSRELESMRRALESRNRQLTMMLGGVAHEVKNPLGGIELFAGLLDEELPAAATDAKAHVSRIRRELDYLKRIVDDFLSFARDEKLQRAALEADQLVTNAAQHLQGEATAHSVVLDVRAEKRTLEGDVSLLTSAVVNLLKNAVQVSGRGQAVSVTGRVDPALMQYVIEVRDRGPGIAAHQQASIFEPFFTTREKGTGLGLPLARKIVEAHRGVLSVQSVPGETVFRIELPLGS